MKGKDVKIRPVRREDLELLESWVNNVEVEGEFNDFGFKGHESMEGAFQKEGFINDRQGTLMIETLNDDIVGALSYYQARYGPKDVHLVYGIGLHVVPEQRGKGFGTEAQQLMADYLFSTFPIMRVEALTDVKNIAEQRSLEKAGFTREGIVRRAQWRHGDWHDLVLYSKLRGE